MEMTTAWNYGLVALSVIIAIFGSYVALDLAQRMQLSRGRSRRFWFIGGALMMGLAIWTMHFVGMLALITPIKVTYDGLLMGLSMLADPHLGQRNGASAASSSHACSIVMSRMDVFLP